MKLDIVQLVKSKSRERVGQPPPKQVMKDRKREARRDKTGRKAKYKQQDS